MNKIFEQNFYFKFFINLLNPYFKTIKMNNKYEQ